MEFWWKADSDDRWTWLPPHIPVTPGPAQEAVITVPAGAPGLIFACPRLTDDQGALKYKQPDDVGEEVIWNVFCLYTRFVGQRREDKPRDRCLTAPQITNMIVGYGSVTVHWTNPERYDKFSLQFKHTEWGEPKTFVTKDQFYRVDKLPTGGCWAHVAGIHDEHAWTGTSACISPLSEFKETSLPADMGYVEAQFAPGTPIAVVKQRQDHTEVFGCLPNGRPVGIWTDTYIWQWHPWYGHGEGPGFPPGAPLAAVSRDDGFMDLFGVASDGRVYLAWWHGNPWREWFVLWSAPLGPDRLRFRI